VSAVTENAVDRASRPARDSQPSGKPAAIIGASAGITGTARGQSQLRRAFEFTDWRTMPRTELPALGAREKFDAQAGAPISRQARVCGSFSRLLPPGWRGLTPQPLRTDRRPADRDAQRSTETRSDEQ
jgi:NAD(P)H-dependent FMN reductase